MSPTAKVAGYRRITNDLTLPIDQAVVWAADGTYSILPVGGPYAQAYANGFDGSDQPVGTVTTNLGEYPKPVVWTSSGPTYLPTPRNAGAAITGSSQYIIGITLDGENAACYWENNVYHRIQGMDDRTSRPFSVNNDGWYAGASFVPGVTNTWAGFVGRGGTSMLLQHPDFPNTLAFAINNNNWVAGEYRPTDSQLPYLWHDGQFVKLGLFPGYNAAKAYAINDDNTAVGGASNYGGDVEKALVWFNGSTTPTDLNLLINIPNATLINCLDINNNGQIFAEARLNDNSGYTYYVLTPIPEPAAALGAACGLLLLRRRG